ncbi:MAG: PIN domain-containing protein [Nitrososphaeraceae archaeon]
MRLYLDNSFLNRPFDNPEVRHNRLEVEILFLILELVTEGKITLVNSSVIEYENSLNPFPERKIFIEKIMQQAKVYQNVDQKIKKRAVEIEKAMKTQPIDALHIASAESAHVELFITSDYTLVKRYKGVLKLIRPLDFMKYYENTNR